jgi:thiol-disulfide isomerase/thioredoxin
MPMMHLFVLFACADPPPPPQPAPPPPHWAQRSDVELDAVLTGACEAAIADKKPVLLEFSAPWCIDCKKLEYLESNPALAAEYDHWHRVRVDIGRFDRHEPLRKAFDVHAIAFWAALRPESCTISATEWPRLKSAVLELETGTSGPRTVDDVVKWLVEARS